jgi:hypothetical protein
MMRYYRVSYHDAQGNLMQTKPLHPDEAEKVLAETKLEHPQAWVEHT